MKKALPLLGWLALGFLLLVSFILDLENLSEGGSIDLRNRITGVRLLLVGIDPYHYKWDETQPEIYADPYNNPRIPVSKTTASPALLLLSAPLAAMPYRLAQFIWFPAQWLLLLGTGLIWWKRVPPSRRFFLALFFTGFTFTAAWRLHVERGQAYLPLGIILAGWLSLTLSQRTPRDFWTGFLAGWLVALRPSFLFLLPFVALHRKRQGPGVLVGLLFGIGLPLFWDSSSWTAYFSGMKAHAFYYVANTPSLPGPQHFPGTIEGIPTDILAHFAAIPYADFSIYRVMEWTGLAFPSGLILALPTIGFGAWLGLTRQRPWQLLLPGLAAWLFLFDLFLPAYRNSYNDVVALNLLALVLVANRPPRGAMIFLLGAIPLGWLVYFLSPEAPWIIDLPALSLTLGALLLLPPAREAVWPTELPSAP